MLTDIDLINDKMMDMKGITKFTGLTDKWFYKLIKEKKFPKPIKQGRSSRWLESEVKAWLLERINESRTE
jgi:predicted DNA-binding transcriptional regulator AlpA